MTNVKSTLTDKELNDTFYRDGDLENSVVDELRAVADFAATKERERIIDYIKQSPPYLFAHSLLLDITKDDDALGRFAYPDEEKS